MKKQCSTAAAAKHGNEASTNRNRKSKIKCVHVIWSRDLGNGFQSIRALVSFAAVRRFLFHAIIHNNNSQVFRLPHSRAHISIFFHNIHRGSLGWFLPIVCACVCKQQTIRMSSHSGCFFHIRHRRTQLTRPNPQSLSNYERRAKRHCFTASFIVSRARSRLLLLLHEKKTVRNERRKS